MGWNDENVDLLKSLWRDGVSCSKIASKIGGVTRNAVIGKVHRLGLAARRTASRVRDLPGAKVRARPAPERLAAANAFAVRAPSRKRTARRKRLTAPRSLPALTAAPDERVTVLTLTGRSCRYPTGDPREPGFHFCGRHKAFHEPYCPHHMAIAYTPSSRSKRRRSRARHAPSPAALYGYRPIP